MGWEFAVLLVVAFMASSALSLWQGRRYAKQLNALARRYRADGRYLVSGRAKGRLGGVIAVLVIDVPNQQVVAAETMTGVSTFAGLRPAPELAGPLASLTERAVRPKLRRAVEAALEQLPTRSASTISPEHTRTVSL